MKTTHGFKKMATRSVLGLALLALLGVGLALPTSTDRSQERTALSAAPILRVVDGTESNGGSGGKPKKRQSGHLA